MNANKTPLKALYLSYDGMTDALGRSQVLAYLSRMAGESVEIHLVSFEKPEVFEEKKQLVEKILQGKNLYWYPLKYTRKPPVFSTIYDLLEGWLFLKKLHKKHLFDLVHCRGYVTALLGAAMQRRFDTRFIFDMRGWWPDEKLESGLWNGKLYRPVYQYFKKREAGFFQKADRIVSLTEAGKNEIIRMGYASAERVGVIPTCVDFDLFKPFDPIRRLEMRKALAIPENAHVLVYSGSLGGNYDEYILFSLFKKYRQVYQDACFLVLSKTGMGTVQPVLEKLEIESKFVKMVSVDYKEVHQYLVAGDVGLIYYQPAFSVIGRSPTKLGEYWACGLPCVAQKGVGDLDMLHQKYPGGLFLMDDMKSETEAETVFAGYARLVADKPLLRKYALDYFDLNRGVAFYLDLYRQLKR